MDIYGNGAVDRYTDNEWAIKFHGYEPQKCLLFADAPSRCPITLTNHKYDNIIDDLAQNDRRITQKRTENRVENFKKRPQISRVTKRP